MLRGDEPGFAEVTDRLLAVAWFDEADDAAMQGITGDILLTKLMQLGVNPANDSQVRATALAAINRLDDWLAEQSADDTIANAHYALARLQIERMRDDPASVELIVPVMPPPGGPIGAMRE